MKYCKHCKVSIHNAKLQVCPLCQTVLDDELPQEFEEEKEYFMQLPGYPPASVLRKKYTMLLRIITFIAVCVMLLLAFINYISYDRGNGILWAAIADAGIVYLLITLWFSIFNAEEGHVAKIAVQCIVVSGLCVIIDVVLGFQGWSLAYVIPGLILLVNALIILLMLINIKNWSSYIVLQIEMVVISAALAALSYLDHIPGDLLTLIATTVSMIIFIGTWIVGGRVARTEINRRFHV